MSCTSSCTFSAERFAILNSAVKQYATMRAATLAAGRSGKLEKYIVREDLIVLDKKITDTVIKMRMLTPCLKK